MSRWTPNTTPVQTREDFVIDELREAIVRGYFKPGEKLDQEEIAELLNVSRIPVRQALRTLTAEGLVKMYPHRGAVVAELSREELEEIYFLRGVLEGVAARLAAPKMDEVHIAKLQAILEKMDQLTDLDGWLDLNRDFHNTIYEVIDRPRLRAMIESLRNTAAPYIREYIASPEYLEATRISHRRILEACINRDGLLAQEETQKHLRVVGEGVLVNVESLLAST
ncbi:MAG: GntR family transcriptional regulator [Anaerolineae bacterium]|nr:GntR family transcriptional regulator [Anaerolineae bacterium]